MSGLPRMQWDGVSSFRILNLIPDMQPTLMPGKVGFFLPVPVCSVGLHVMLRVWRGGVSRVERPDGGGMGFSFNGLW